MAVNIERYKSIMEELGDNKTLVAVSKMRSVEEIQLLYDLGHRDFGENYVQELIEKHLVLPHDIRWHFIGHLQSNKVKYIAPFIYMIHGVESFKLLREINKQGKKFNRVINCLLQVHIAQEETKFGLSEAELDELISGLSAEDAAMLYECIHICGLMGMASFSDDTDKVSKEFIYLESLYDKYSAIHLSNMRFKTLSMGMSADYQLAIAHGSNLVRIGSLLFGSRAL